MNIHVIGNQKTILDQFLFELRDAKIQQDSMRFRRNLERVGEIFAYEISRKLEWIDTEVVTSLGTCMVPVLKNQPVLAAILRAGLPLHKGMLDFFDKAENAFISAYRKYHKDGTFRIEIEYISCPSIDHKTLIIIDPMLASGASMVKAYKEFLNSGTPVHIHFVSVIASVEGVEYMKKHISDPNVSLWTAAIDDELTAQAYIVPGLGDAGDLAYGSKDADPE